jgi:hypothetical protein
MELLADEPLPAATLSHLQRNRPHVDSEPRLPTTAGNFEAVRPTSSSMT